MPHTLGPRRPRNGNPYHGLTQELYLIFIGVTLVLYALHENTLGFFNEGEPQTHYEVALPW
ncbi:MAG: hypothetical protein ACTHWO_09510 [Nesterenkonia sp.]|uniref:Uncharacterized protein n=1 Tax=Garicola koreensis TaxID=1262554 RepID=A0A7W5TPC7_9MICC|nr:hypothetical protein [Garicola koreensis]MBB3666595.1 hypothetical protein [Garicola koreensis]